MKNIAGSEEEAKMSENEYKELDDVLLDTVKDLSCLVKERVKQLKKIELTEGKKFNETLLNTVKELSKIVNLQEQIKISKFNTCYKYLIIPTILLALFVVIFLCCTDGQRNFQCGSHKNPNTIKVQILSKCKF
jgi:hypothetical protein